jgi:hypothetical protein
MTMKSTASIAGFALAMGLSACGAVLESGALPKDDNTAVCVETVPPANNTAEYKPDAPAEGG